MRRLVVLFSVLLLGTCWAAAQDNSHKTNPYSPTQASKDASGQTTVEGCLSARPETSCSATRTEPLTNSRETPRNSASTWATK
jgi:hypothetical protein